MYTYTATRMPLAIPSQPAFIPRNQTPPEWQLTGQNGELGVGLFLVLDPTSEIFPPLRSVAVPEITYAQCNLLGEMAAAFKWIPPDQFNTIDQKTEACVGQCQHMQVCEFQPHCWCINGRCTLKPLQI